MMNKMLTVDTKRKIDSARDILVGKIPDPKAQVEQITTALIYKFMDDMDQEALAFENGKARYFTGDYEKYAWHKIMDTRLGSQERTNLYVEAITKFQTNPNLPLLFRNIFKDSFLPFRNPETLTLFLKQINEFTYDHSEDLGDAYEYLLSIMGSQGDAGQFRTPRHIIEFIVKVVDPKKEDTVLDPACGTSGFLISAYKHILSQHDGKDDNTGEPINSEKRLTPQDRSQITKNFVGYDISPDMVRISEVNMFLHDFTEPKIFEYDTLSSEDKWDDRFDVILANPPFMSPKGGIRPHKRFSIQANRSEVLFVDYIMEHLKPKGRAGIIVPEGIIFQSGNAYKELRKKLIEDGLFCVVSLPSGVFQPYSGVKTSILLFDNEISKKVKHMMFVKISSDGFELGSQRKPSIYNDLPLAQEAILKYRKHVNAGGKLSIGGWPEGGPENIDTYPNLQFFSKEELLKSADHNLTGGRYAISERGAEVTGKWPMAKLGNIVDILNGYAFKSTNYVKDGIRIIRITNVQKGEIVDANPKFYPEDSKEPTLKYLLKFGDVLLSLTGNVGRVGILPLELLPAALNQRVACLRPHLAKINSRFLFYILNYSNFESDCINASTGVAQKNLSTDWLAKYEIPIPSLQIQRQVVEELDGYQRIIDGANQVIKNWKPRIDVSPKWKKVKLSEVCEIKSTLIDPRDERFSDLMHVGGANIETRSGDIINLKSAKEEKLISGKFLFDENTVLYSKIRPYLMKVARPSFKGLCSADIYPLFPMSNKLTRDYLFYLLLTDDFTDYAVNGSSRVGMPKVNREHLFEFSTFIPSLEIQKQIVDALELERHAVQSNKQLIEIYEDKIKNKINSLFEK